jgi:hypothetical protein
MQDPLSTTGYGTKEYFDWSAQHVPVPTEKLKGKPKDFELEPCSESLANFIAHHFWAPDLIKARRNGTWTIHVFGRLSAWVGLYKGQPAMLTFLSDTERELQTFEIQQDDIAKTILSEGGKPTDTTSKRYQKAKEANLVGFPNT